MKLEMHLEMHVEAKEELREAAHYYESRQSGLGSRFLDVIEDSFSRIESEPEVWAPVEGDIRRCLAHIFPYAIFYSIERQRILILAVAHLAREPGYWTARSRDRT